MNNFNQRLQPSIRIKQRYLGGSCSQSHDKYPLLDNKRAGDDSNKNKTMQIQCHMFIRCRFGASQLILPYGPSYLLISWAVERRNATCRRTNRCWDIISDIDRRIHILMPTCAKGARGLHGLDCNLRFCASAPCGGEWRWSQSSSPWLRRPRST